MQTQRLRPSTPAGTHESLRGSESALATVTAIIDGFGSLGASLGPLLTGYISSMEGGFNNVFNMLYAAAICASLLISRLVVRELKLMFKKSPPPPKKPSRRLRTGGGEERERLLPAEGERSQV